MVSVVVFMVSVVAGNAFLWFPSLFLWFPPVAGKRFSCFPFLRQQARAEARRGWDATDSPRITTALGKNGRAVIVASPCAAQRPRILTLLLGCVGSIPGARVFKVIVFTCFCLLVVCIYLFLFVFYFLPELGSKAEKQSREAPLRVMFPLRFRHASVTFPLRFRGAPPRGPCQGQV